MDRHQSTSMANKFQAVLDADVLNARGKQLGFAKRERLITPFRLGLSVVASMATQQVQTIADLHRQFNELWAFESDYKAFYTQLHKPPYSVRVIKSCYVESAFGTCAIFSRLLLESQLTT